MSEAVKTQPWRMPEQTPRSIVWAGTRRPAHAFPFEGEIRMPSLCGIEPRWDDQPMNRRIGNPCMTCHRLFRLI